MDLGTSTSKRGVRRRAARRIAALALLSLSLGGRGTFAADANEPGSRPAQLRDAEVSARLAALTSALDAGEQDAKLWWTGWLGLFSASALASGTIALSASSSTAPVWRIGALRSTLGVLSVLAVPDPAASGPALLRDLPESTAAEREFKLRAARSTLHRAAEVERLTRSWLAHASGIAASAAFSLWIWRGYHQPGAAAISCATGLLASEAKIFTSPTRAIEDEARLEAAPAPAANSLAPQQLGHQASLRLALAPVPGGLALAGSF